MIDEQFKIISFNVDKINQKLGAESDKAKKRKKKKINSIVRKELKSLKKTTKAKDFTSNVEKLNADQKGELIEKINNIRMSLVELDPKGKQGAKIIKIFGKIEKQIYDRGDSEGSFTDSEETEYSNDSDERVILEDTMEDVKFVLLIGESLVVADNRP